MLVAELLDLIVDPAQDLAGLFQPFFVRADKFRWIGERPVQSRRHAGKNWTALRFRFVANRDDEREQLTGYEYVEDGPSFVLRNVDPNLVEDLDGERIKRTRFETGAVRFEKIAAPFVEQRRGHLAARAVVNTNEKHFLFHNFLGTARLALRLRRAIPRFASSSRRFKNDPKYVVTLSDVFCVICGWEEILIAVLNSNFRIFIDRNQFTDLVINADELPSRHVVIVRARRYPKLQDSFIPSVLLPATINRVVAHCLNFGQVITAMNGRPFGTNKNQFAVWRRAQCVDELLRFHVAEISDESVLEQHPSSRTKRQPTTATKAPAMGATT